MVLNIFTEQIKETRFLSQISGSYLSNLDGEPQVLKNQRMKNENGVKIRIFKIKESIYIGFKFTKQHAEHDISNTT